MDAERLSLTIGRLPGENTWWLCLADMDSTEVTLLAEFQSEAHSKLFTSYMATHGYASIPLPNSQDINELFDE